MASLNSCQFIGRIGRDPESRYTQSGQCVVSFSLAVDESYRDKAGNKVEQTEWINCVAWGKQAEFISNYLSKGRLVHVIGKFKTEKYTDKAGVEKYATKINVISVQGLDRKPEGAGQPSPQSQPGPGQGSEQPPYNANSELDEAPF